MIQSCKKLSVQFSSVTQPCSTLWDPMDYSTPGFPVRNQLSVPTQTPVHWIGDAIQLSHPLLSPSPPTLNHSQHQGLFKWVSSSHQVVKVLEFWLQYQSFQWIFRVDFIWDWLVWSPCYLRNSQESLLDDLVVEGFRLIFTTPSERLPLNCILLFL